MTVASLLLILGVSGLMTCQRVETRHRIEA